MEPVQINPHSEANSDASLLRYGVDSFIALDSVRAGNAALCLNVARHVRPLVVHVHIPKCAGTSFNDLLRRSAGGAHLDLYLPTPRSVIPIESLAQSLRADPNLRSIASHSIRLFPTLLAGRIPLYVAFLRDPRQWYLSNMTFLIKNYHTLTAEHRAQLPATCPEMSVVELSTWLMDRNDRENRPPADITDFLAGPTFNAHVAPSLPAIPSASADLDAAMVAIARHLLSRFFFVGVVERLSLELPLLYQRLASVGIRLDAAPDVPLLNTSNELRGDTSWMAPDHPTGSRVLRTLRRDVVLYDYACHLSRQSDPPN